MTHRYSVGQQVHFTGRMREAGGTYRIVRLLPIENDRQIRYRVKSATEAFERIVEEDQLSGR